MENLIFAIVIIVAAVLLSFWRIYRGDLEETQEIKKECPPWMCPECWNDEPCEEVEKLENKR